MLEREASLRAQITRDGENLRALIELSRFIKEPEEAAALGRRAEKLLESLSEERSEQAFERLESAAEAFPEDEDLQWGVAEAFRSARQLKAARRAYRRYLRLSPGDPSALHLLAAVGGAPTPMRSNDGYLIDLFDQFAPDFDQILEELDYQAPKHISRAVERFLPRDEPLSAADLGCGTGLCGLEIAPFVSELLGVDLSKESLTLAEKRGVYDALEHEEIMDFLALYEEHFSILTAADVLVYFGDLGPFLYAAAEALRPDGILIFTVEKGEGMGRPQLQTTGRFTHNEQHILDQAYEAELELLGLEEVCLRYELSEPVWGWLVSLRRPEF